jgi:class 3 adenylate cyclase/tetratricopeptide (TPR) repeat protein
MQPVEPDDQFCGSCGTRLGSAEATPVAPAPASAPERRVVSVLFADIVGSTTHAEGLDPEDVRALLDAYFSVCRQVITRYGGTVEKFIGDAVMALWGAPVAREDDAERAVRAGLELLSQVEALAPRAGGAGLRARAGVVTGEAAVTINAEGQGLVAGDTVNTAARVQSAADAGEVFVDDRTRSAAGTAIVFADRGNHDLKGKALPAQLWQAQRVVAGVGGLLRVGTLEAPFVGRDRELRLVKELFHATAGESRARLVSVVGVAGIGKSRLAWEFEKYLDGLADDVLWHRGRCLPYGEGVTYWAVAEMVRGRCGISETDSRDVAVAKLAAKVTELIPDVDNRRFAEPTLAHLLGIGERLETTRADLFGGWRMFFERLALQEPTVLVFEDLQWADDGVFDFMEHLLDWSRGLPLYVLALARPEVSDRRPGWGAAHRAFTSIYLDPLPLPMVEQMLAALVPGLPDETRVLLAAQSEGIPLYTIETVRMLLDRGVLKQDGDRYVLLGDVDAVDVPDTLHALIQARLDGLSPDERDITQHAAVLGQTVAPGALAAVSGRSPDELADILSGLVRKEIVALQSDPLLAERGQYAFVQGVVRRIAYDMLGRHERRTRHLAAAAYLEGLTGTALDEIPEVVADHYLQAYYADPDDAEGRLLRDRARAAIGEAAERARSLGSMLLAMRLYERAASLADDALDRADLEGRAGECARFGGDDVRAEDLLRRALPVLLEGGRTDTAIAAADALAGVMSFRRPSEAQALLDDAKARLGDTASPAQVAMLDIAWARGGTFAGRYDEATARVEAALIACETGRLTPLLTQALIVKSTLLSTQGRRIEGLALLEKAEALARDNQLVRERARAHNNLVNEHILENNFEEALEYATASVEVQRRRGERMYLLYALADQAGCLFHLGRWAEARDIWPDIAAIDEDFAMPWLWIPLFRLAAASGSADDIPPPAEVQPDRELDQQTYAAWLAHQAVHARANGQPAEAARLGPQVLAAEGWEWISELREGFAETGSAAVEVGDDEWLRTALSDDPRLMRPRAAPFVFGTAERLRGRVAARDDQGVERALDHLARAVETLRAAGMRFELANALGDQAAILADFGDPAYEVPLTEAGDILRDLGAVAALHRLEAALPRR